MALDQRKTKALVALHGWSAVFLGLLLYAVVITGAAAVFEEEIRHWSIGTVANQSPFSLPIDKMLRAEAAGVNPEHLEEVTLSTSASGYLGAFFHTHVKAADGQIEEYGERVVLDPATAQVVERRTGTVTELFQQDNPGALAQFIVSIHTELHLPRPWGLMLTGILGLVLLVSAISGFLIHGHLFKEAFTLRRGQNTLVNKRDLHSLAGSWGLPFAFVLAFTGSFFSFAGAFGIPAMAIVAFGGDQEAMIRTLIDQPAVESATPGPAANLDTVIADATRRSGAAPVFASISAWGEQGSRITVFTPASGHRLTGQQFEYSGNTGTFQREKPALGKAPSAGATAVSLMGPLHFGNFAGLLSKLVWGALAFALCYVVITGFNLWLQRRAGEAGWDWLHRSLLGVGYGIPIAMLASSLAYFTAPVLGLQSHVAVPWSFVIVGIAVLAWSFTSPELVRLNQQLFYLCALFCLLSPAARLATGGIGWLGAIQQGNLAVPMLDTSLLMMATFLVFRAARQSRHADRSGGQDGQELVMAAARAGQQR